MEFSLLPNEMNYYPNPYFQSFFQNPYTERTYFAFSESSAPNQETKYVKILQQENKLLREKIGILQTKIGKYQELQKEEQKITNKKREKITEDDFSHECIYSNCDKNYKSSLALNLHIKLKHNGGSIRERQAYAKLILQCERENKPMPQININFPPNFIENYRKRIRQSQQSTKSSLQ